MVIYGRLSYSYSLLNHPLLRCSGRPIRSAFGEYGPDDPGMLGCQGGSKRHARHDVPEHF